MKKKPLVLWAGFVGGEIMLDTPFRGYAGHVNGLYHTRASGRVDFTDVRRVEIKEIKRKRNDPDNARSPVADYGT